MEGKRNVDISSENWILGILLANYITRHKYEILVTFFYNVRIIVVTLLFLFLLILFVAVALEFPQISSFVFRFCI